MEAEGCESVGCKLRGRVGDVQEFGGDVTLPEGCEAFLAQDSEEGLDGAFVERRLRGGRLGLNGGAAGMGLELKADFDDIERGNDKARSS